MPGTAHRVADDQALGERPVVVRAVRADREELVAAPRQDHLVVVDAATDDGTVRDV